jgi:hypothetical protein
MGSRNLEAALRGCLVAGVVLAFVLSFRAAAATGPSANQEYSLDPYATSMLIELRPPIERASLNLRRPGLRDLYQAIADAYGVRLLYDRDLENPEVVSNFVVEDATLQEALDAAGSISSTFVAPLDQLTGIVAADTNAKRGEYERQVLASFHAGDRTTPQQLTEIVTAMRTLLDLRRISQDTRQNWITARGLTRQIAAANQFFQTLERPRGEVFIEAEILEINSSRARSLGLQPPQPFVLQFLGRTVSNVSSSLFSLGGGRTLYGLLLPAAAADLSFSSSVFRSYQVIRLRANQDEEASLRLGTRYPVITATVSSGFSDEDPTAALGFFPQIQYEDIGVTVSATPHLHAGRELTLVLDLALRDLGARDLNGLPTFTNRQVTGQVRLKEGESYLIGGIRTRTRQDTRTGYPLLSRIPLLGPLFALFRKQEVETETWIHIRPYILREAPAEQFASRAIFFGKELPGVTPPALQPSQPGAVPVIPPPGIPPPGAVPPGAEQPGAPQPGVPPLPDQEPGVAPQPGVQPQPGIFPPGVFPPGVFPPGLQQPQPGVPQQPGQQQPPATPSPFDRPGFGTPGPGTTPPIGTVPQPGQQQQRQ